VKGVREELDVLIEGSRFATLVRDTARSFVQVVSLFGNGSTHL
jgi:hypothetical protein